MSSETLSGMPVVMLEIDTMGQVKRRLPRLARTEQLDKTLLQELYPDIHVARLSIPAGRLEDYQEARVVDSMQRVEVDGVRYRLIGASASAKSGKFYAVDERYEKAIADRFRRWPQAAITYFGILVSPCRERIQLPEARLLIVKDCTLGTNDCRGWISQAVFDRFRLPGHRLYQFRLAFENTQAKGACKVMADDVATKLGADIILPESCVKPEFKQPSRFLDFFNWRRPKVEIRTYRGPIVLGIRDVSRPLQLQSSYTLIEHAPSESLQFEILPFATEQARRLRTAYEERHYETVLELLGNSRTPQPGEEEVNPEFTSVEDTIIKAILKVDSSGYLIEHPHVNDALNRMLATWTFKLCTAGGFTIPGYALADDGFLALHEDDVVCASDWLPTDRAIASVLSQKGLVVRYPIRMFEDLLPYTRLTNEEAVSLVTDAIREQNGRSIVEAQVVAGLIEQQITLDGTLTLNSRKAAENGGDFDFDLVGVVEGDRFPRFVESRFQYQGRHEKEKSKPSKRSSPWWNLAKVASEAKGNAIGSITDLKTSCYASGQPDLAYQLVTQLQHALDSLKHGTEIDQELVSEIRQRVPTAPWLRLKNLERVTEMPIQLEVLPTDRIGYLYNIVRKEVGDIFSKKRPIGDFHGLITGEHFTPEMTQECRLVNTMYADQIGKLIKEQQHLQEALVRAEAEYEAKRNDELTRKQARDARNSARLAVHTSKERFREEFKALRSIFRGWGDGKKENRRGWCQALHAIVCAGKGNGSLLFHAFPQEIIDKVIETTGGKPVQVSVPGLVDGEIEFDDAGRVFLIEHAHNNDGSTYDRKILLLEVSGRGEIFVGGKFNQRISPIPMRAGTGSIRDGKVVFDNIPQRPYVRPPKTKTTHPLDEAPQDGPNSQIDATTGAIGAPN